MLQTSPQERVQVHRSWRHDDFLRGVELEQYEIVEERDEGLLIGGRLPAKRIARCGSHLTA
jgi:hypothetical protein